VAPGQRRQQMLDGRYHDALTHQGRRITHSGHVLRGCWNFEVVKVGSMECITGISRGRMQRQMDPLTGMQPVAAGGDRFSKGGLFNQELLRFYPCEDLKAAKRCKPCADA
jgi:hypothetical protein